MTPLVWIVVAFVTAIVVMVLAGSATGARPGVRQFVADLRDGVRRSPDAGVDVRAVGRLPEPEDVGDAAVVVGVGHGVQLPTGVGQQTAAPGVADIFRLGQPTDRAY